MKAFIKMDEEKVMSELKQVDGNLCLPQRYFMFRFSKDFST